MSFEFIYVPFSYLMKGCLFITGNKYALALLFFALALQVIMIPVYIKQQKSQIMAAKVRPMEMAIREQYKGRTDRATMQKMNMEIQEMYQKSGYSQFSGCLPMLITLPLIFILYAIVRQPISYASDITKSDSGFIDRFSKNAVEFYQAEKEELIKDAYEDVGDYNKQISELESLQVRLGGKIKTEKNADNKDVEVKTESGVTVYEFDKSTSTGELYLAKLIVDGGEDLDAMIEKGYLPAEIKTVYGEYNFAAYSEQLPDFHIFGLSLLDTSDFGAHAWLLFVPVLVFLTQFFSLKLNRKLVPGVPGPNGKPVGSGLFMEVGMPLISAVVSFQWPAAMGVYWIWRTLLDMVKSLIINKAMPIPRVTPEQIAEAKKELKGSAKPGKKKRITIEVDEDDTSYDELVVKNGGSSGAVHRASRIEMLSADENDLPEKNRADEPAGEDNKEEE